MDVDVFCDRQHWISSGLLAASWQLVRPCRDFRPNVLIAIPSSSLRFTFVLKGVKVHESRFEMRAISGFEQKGLLTGDQETSLAIHARYISLLQNFGA